MSKKRKRKKSENAFMTWLVGALTDLVIGIILLIISELIN